MPMTPDAKRELSRTIRDLRAHLLSELAGEARGRYRLAVPAAQAGLTEANAAKRARLDTWIAEQARGLPVKERTQGHDRFLDQVVAEAGATLLNRLVVLRLMEASGLRRDPVVTGGWNSRGYRDFRDLAPELVREDDTEGYAFLLKLVCEDLARDLPGLFGDVGLTSLIPVPAATLRHLVAELDKPALESCWADDTTLGWVYQYWNDPAREALDDKLNRGGKVAPHEIASKTQMFTERYMVEWLLHNSLGQMWLAMCKKHGWTPQCEADGTLDRLEARRKDWRAKRDAGEVALDALMPIEPGMEDRWKYWVPQPMPDDAVTHAPDSVRALKILDPACGSGHFLVIAFDLLFALYTEEAEHRGEQWSELEIAEGILEDNLHGIDIDPRCIQIAAAALLLKARQRVPQAHPRQMNLVAPAFKLAALAHDDPALIELRGQLQAEVGLPPELTDTLVAALRDADHLGSLLKIDAAVDEALAEHERASGASEGQGALFARPDASVGGVDSRQSVLQRLETFLARHGSGEDLGLRLRGAQLAAGIRFMRINREGAYDLVVANPPYQGTSKMADAKYVQKHYKLGKADLYAAFLLRGLELVREGGLSAMLTMRNWMFIKQFARLREDLLGQHGLRALHDLSSGAFEEISPAQVVVSVVSSVFACGMETDQALGLKVFDGDTVTEQGETQRKRAATLCQVGRHEFDPAALKVVPEWPLVYWWSRSKLEKYRVAPKLGEVAPAREGLGTRDDTRFIRLNHEVRPASVVLGTRTSDWVPLVKGAAGRAWMEGLDHLVFWRDAALALRVWIEHYRKNAPGQYIKNRRFYFKQGIAFSTIGATFSARIHRFASVFGERGSSVFPEDLAAVLCAMNRSAARQTLQDLNPTVTFKINDVNRLPIAADDLATDVLAMIDNGFGAHELHRERSAEFAGPGPSHWRYTQDWAQRCVDRPRGAPLPNYEPEDDPEPPTDHVSFAVGVALGRFGANGEGILDDPPATALPDGILFLADDGGPDSLSHPAAAVIRRAWDAHGPAIDKRLDLNTWLRTRFFKDIHRQMYENRPIYFPISSARKSFVAFVSIHRWAPDTLRALLADHLQPTQSRLQGELSDLLSARQSPDAARSRSAEQRYDTVKRLHEELSDLIDLVVQCAERGPPATDPKCPERETDARYAPDLDDGVMINSAALWPLLEPQWKDPKKWWKELATAKGRKDYDWAHLAARYFPERVDAKCKVDPSLGVAHGCFWRYHPERALAWELRLQDEIGPEFTIDEQGSDEARAALLRDHPDKAAELRDKEARRRVRKHGEDADAPTLPWGEGDDD